MTKLAPLLTFLTSFMISSCTTIAEHFPGVYAIDIQQGNIIDQEMINQLRPNMNKRQVLYILGSPMLTDVFHKKRWDYIYSEQLNGEARLQKRISLFFEEETLIGVQGDFKPSERPVQPISHETTVDVPERQIDDTMFGQVSNFFSSDDSEKTSTNQKVDQSNINSEPNKSDKNEIQVDADNKLSEAANDQTSNTETIEINIPENLESFNLPENTIDIKEFKEINEAISKQTGNETKRSAPTQTDNTINSDQLSKPPILNTPDGPSIDSQ